MIIINKDKHIFTCPHCGNKISWKVLIDFQNKLDTITCEHCNTILTSKNIMSFAWGFFWGCLGFLAPAKSITYLYNNAWYGLIAGLIGGVIAFCSVIIYVYNTTEFIETL